MLASFGLLLAFLSSMTAEAAPLSARDQSGTIQLLRNGVTTYTLLVDLNPTDYTNTFGSAQLDTNDGAPESTSLEFYVTANTPSGSNTTFYTIHSDVISSSNPPAAALLTNVTMLNVAPQYFPNKQLYLFSSDINGQPAMSGQYNWETEVLQAYDFEASLLANLNVTGLIRAVNGDIID